MCALSEYYTVNQLNGEALEVIYEKLTLSNKTLLSVQNINIKSTL